MTHRAEILIVDLETTGLDPATEQIVEIGAVPFRPPSDGIIQSLVRPTIDIPVTASAVHHLTADDVKDAPMLDDVMENVLPRMSAFPIWAAHNAAFERGFLDPVLFGTDVAPIWICTYKCAVTLWPDLPTHSNAGLIYALDLFESHTLRNAWLAANPLHRAVPDAMITGLILARILAKITIHTAIEISQLPVLLPRIPFGKMRGQPWSDADAGYLNWVLGKDFSDDVHHTARHWLGQLTGTGPTS